MREVLCVSIYKSGNVPLPFGRGRSVCVSFQNALNTKSRPPFMSRSVFAGGPSFRGGDRISDNFQVFHRQKCKQNERQETVPTWNYLSLCPSLINSIYKYILNPPSFSSNQPHPCPTVILLLHRSTHVPPSGRSSTSLIPATFPLWLL